MVRRFYKLVISGGLFYQYSLCDAAVGLESEYCSNIVFVFGSLAVKRRTVYFIQGVDRQTWRSKNCK